jgi:transketolase
MDIGKDTDDLKRIAKEIRLLIINMISAAGHGHAGGSLSCVDILTVLYFQKMRIDPANPIWDERDRFILSKGHAAPALYSTLAKRGYFPEDVLYSFGKLGSMLQGHPDMNLTPGVDMSTGSLGQGISVANGMAFAAKLDNKPYRVYVVLGDGELQEGQIWEAAMTSSHYKLDNLTAILDFNGLQIDGTNDEVKRIQPVSEKFSSFGWNVININGHDLFEIGKAIDEAKATIGKPTIILAKTIKGKGVSFMENQVEWHAGTIDDVQKRRAIMDINGE